MLKIRFIRQYSLRALLVLYLGSTQVSDQALLDLADCSQLKNIVIGDGNRITNEGILALQQRRPDLVIERSGANDFLAPSAKPAATKPVGLLTNGPLSPLP